MAIQLDLWPWRLSLDVTRRVALPGQPAQFFPERLTARVLRRWRRGALVQFEGERRDGSWAGCIGLLDTVLPDRKLSGGAMLASAMRRGRRGPPRPVTP